MAIDRTQPNQTGPRFLSMAFKTIVLDYVADLTLKSPAFISIVIASEEEYTLESTNDAGDPMYVCSRTQLSDCYDCST